MKLSRKNRHIASFGDVANVNKSDIVHENNNININKNNNIIDNKNNIENNIGINNEINNDNENENVDVLDNIINNNKKKDQTHILKGIYFEREVAAAIDRIARKGGKGIKSQIVNEAVKKVFKEKGWL
jgi:hypothetical protein